MAARGLTGVGAASQNRTNLNRGTMTTCTATDPHIDLSEAEALLELPIPIPIHAVSGIVGRDGSKALASFNARNGIDYDLAAIEDACWDLNEVLLHELVHAWQFFRDPAGFEANAAAEIAEYGYWDAPYEVEARELAWQMHDAGVQVEFS
jgi:hypothetical protein